MIKHANKIIRSCNILCALLMLAVMVCQFLPFWHHIDGYFLTEEEVQMVKALGHVMHFGEAVTEDSLETLSIADAVWFPRDYLGAPLPMGHVLVLITGVLGLIFCLKDNERTWASILAVMFCLSGIGTYGWLFENSVTGMGWQVHVGILIALSVPALILSIYNIRRIKEFFTKRQY